MTGTKSNSKLLDEAYEIYKQEGSSGVLTWAVEHHPEFKWKYCEPCEESTPELNGLCAVCWNVFENGLTKLP